jgi:polar amino acid transport system substrate-binding protein
VLGLVATLAACGSASSPSPSAGASQPATTSAAPSQQPCATDTLATKVAGTWTVGTDNPAFPPYFDPPTTSETATDPWELGDPTNGRGFESAVAYAIAAQLGFSKDKVAWIVVPFDSSFAPGPKAFDVYLAQVSYQAERAQNADLSDGYYFLNQALVARKGAAIASAKTVSDVAKYRLGAATNTTSLTYINEQIHPTTEARVYNDNDAAIAGLNANQVNGIVVDLPTAFYITGAQMKDGVIVGQFPSVSGEQEHFSLVLELHSPLTDCVNKAIAALKANGSLDAITKEWMSDKANAPLIGQ